MVLERESFEIFIGMKDHYTLEKAVRFNLKDYKFEKHVDLVRITTRDNVTILVLSDTLTYQSHVPF